ncbi:AIPR family protein [Variovorax sp. LjRoot130]|uniref:AIPR family protein n=1 Tax=Variovorax sp. LjRoot130 TaxID=3342261 RepID=UPI003ECEC633
MAATPLPKSTAQTNELRKELLSAIDAVSRRGGISRDRALTAWYGHTLLGIDEDEAIDAATVDGPEDAGCDFIYIDEDLETIYVLQGYVADRADRAATIKKWNALVAAVATLRDPIAFKHGGRSDIYDRLKDLDLDAFSLIFGLITLAAKSEQISRQRETTIRSKIYGAEVSFFYEHQDSLYDQYVIAKAADRNVPQDTIQFNGGVAELRGEFGVAVVGTVSASELERLHSTYGNRLFEGNVRLFIGQRKGGINEKILQTAQSRPGDFWALNNGITIVADSYEAVGSSATKFRLRQFSIVNGCQTTVSLSKAIEQAPEAGRSQVLVRVVGAKKALLTDIVRYNNTQNPVRLSAVRLLDPIQESLRTAFSQINYIYAPKQEGARLIKSAKRIELDKISQYLASMSEETVLDAVRRKAELFDRSYKLVFPRGIQPTRVFLAWLLAIEVERERTVLLDANDGDDAIVKAILGIHGTPWGIFVATKLIEKLGTDMTRLTLVKMDTQDFQNAVNKYAKRAMELYSEIAVTLVGSEDDGSDVRNEIRVRTFLDKLNRTVKLRMAKASTWKLPKLQLVAN